MPPKGRKAAEKEKAKDVQETEEKLQAVVLTDSFETRFGPLTLEKPRCLLPLVNATLLEYTLQWLEYAGVQQVFIYPGNHADQIEAYINGRSSDFEVEIIQNESQSIGDAMRDLDKRGIMTGDFLVVHGDVVSNLNLDDALARHRARRAADKNAIMTMLVMEAGSPHRATDRSKRGAFLIDPKKDRILQYEQLSRRAEFYTDAEHYETHDVLQERYDLIDCGIDICTPDVLLLWSDNFDYEFPRKNFLHSVLKDYELNGKTIHIYKTGKKYAAHARNLHAYSSIARDILSGLTLPMHPSTGLLESDTTYRRYYNGHGLKAEDAFIDRSARVDENSVVGKNARVAPNCKIVRSVIGRNCKLEEGCRIEGSHLADNCTLGRGSQVFQSFLASGVSLGEECTVSDDCIIAYGVQIPSKTAIQPRSRITKVKLSKEESKAGQPPMVGNGHGYEPQEGEEDEDDVTGLSGRTYTEQDYSDSEDSISTLNSDDEFADVNEPIHTTSGSFASVASNESGRDDDARAARTFHEEASASILDSLQQGHNISTISLELQGLRMTSNASDHQIRRAVAVGITKHVLASRKGGLSAKEIVKNAKELMTRTIHDGDKEQKTDQVDFLLLTQKELADKADGDSALLAMCNALYLEEIVDDEGLEQWWGDKQSTATAELRKVREKTQQLMDALAEEEEDSEEETRALSRPITPPATKKRKAAEITKTSPAPAPNKASSCSSRPTKVTRNASTSTATSASDTDRGDHLSSPPATGSQEYPSKNPQLDDAKHPDLKGLAPQTPASTRMDSDDDFNSVASSDGFGNGDNDSDISVADDNDFDEPDAAFDIGDKDFKSKKNSYEVDFKVYSPADIQSYQDRQISEVSMIIGQPPESSAILLRRHRWNKERLIESYMDNEDQVLEDAGLGAKSKHQVSISRVPGFTCTICFDDSTDMDTFAMECGHRFCVGCYQRYLAQKIKEEGESARIKCPGDTCNRIVDTRSLDLLVAADLRDRYQELLTRTYVDDKANLKWCPAPNCVYAVDCAIKQPDFVKIVPSVKCECGYSFCFGCSRSEHQPSPCMIVKKWLKKCEDDSETANWISANTKECPKCYSTIEKNGGCNHMTCRKCKYEFCWMCMGVWSEHGTSWYNCSRYEEKSGHEARDAQAKSRQSLERYLHYYNRYANHEQSAKLDKDIALKAEKKMTGLQTTSGMTWIEVQFLSAASQCLQDCRQTLKWTYAFAYYLKRNNMTYIFEDNQRDLEMAVENLSEMFEKPVDQLASLKVEMMDKISYCTKRRQIVLETTLDELRRGKWEFNTDISE